MEHYASGSQQGSKMRKPLTLMLIGIIVTIGLPASIRPLDGSDVCRRACIDQRKPDEQAANVALGEARVLLVKPLPTIAGQSGAIAIGFLALYGFSGLLATAPTMADERMERAIRRARAMRRLAHTRSVAVLEWADHEAG